MSINMWACLSLGFAAGVWTCRLLEWAIWKLPDRWFE